MIKCQSYLNSMSDIVNKKYEISGSSYNNIVSLYAVESYKNCIPLRDKIEAGADLVRTVTSIISYFVRHGVRAFIKLITHL